MKGMTQNKIHPTSPGHQWAPNAIVASSAKMKPIYLSIQGNGTLAMPIGSALNASYSVRIKEQSGNITETFIFMFSYTCVSLGKIANLDSTKGCMEMMSRHQCGGTWIRCIISLPLLVVQPVTKDLPPQYPKKKNKKTHRWQMWQVGTKEKEVEMSWKGLQENVHWTRVGNPT